MFVVGVSGQSWRSLGCYEGGAFESGGRWVLYSYRVVMQPSRNSKAKWWQGTGRSESGKGMRGLRALRRFGVLNV